MTWSKRIFDLTLAALLLIPVLVLCAGIAVWLRIVQGGPVFHVSERMRAHDRAFALWKFRTMTPCPDAGVATGGDTAARITPAGRWLRATRLDELPQLWNILRGDLSFVGPRPPLRRYVDRHPALYARVLRSRPGVTGLATLVYHRAEARVLAACTTPGETDALYSRVCVPRKARLDLIYQRHASWRLDALVLWQTLARLAGRARRGV